MGMKNHEGYQDPTAYKAIRCMVRRNRENQDKPCEHLTSQFQELRAFRDCVKCLYNTDVRQNGAFQ